MSASDKAPSDPKWWERLATTEASIKALTENVGIVTQAVRELTDKVSNNLATYEHRLAGIGKTDWGMLSGWAAVILSIVAMVGGALGVGFVRDMNRVEAAQLEHNRWATNKAMEIEFERGRAEQQRMDLRANVAKLDVDLQREMRDVNATTEAKLEGLDRRIQAEIYNSASVNRGRIEALEAFQARANEMHAATAAELRALRRQVFGDPD